jgi:DNA-binding response OmpR family regulator
MRVLVVEDDPALGPLIARGLQRHHHAVDLAATFQEATEAAAVTDYDVVCLDLCLPDGDGIDLCRRLHTADGLRRPRRILAVTARDGIASRIAGLDAGADDYLVKPFAFDELVARVRALDRRRDDHGTIVTCGDVVIDLASHRASRAGRPLDLTSRELAVLVHLAKHRGAVVSVEALLEHCWDANADPFTGSPKVIVSRLRRKLGDPPLIETLARAGYRMSADADALPDSDPNPDPGPDVSTDVDAGAEP